MKHSGKARRAALRMLAWTFFIVMALILGGGVAYWLGSLILGVAGAALALWVVFALFVLYFFRDPESHSPQDPQVIVSPAYGKVDVIDETTEPDFLGGPCRRVSIFLSVLDVHVQKAPISGKIEFLRHCPGQFLNAMRTDCGLHNENVLLGFESQDTPGEKVSLRLIAGVLARRIVPWVGLNDTVARGERISLIQFGSRVDVYLPLKTRVVVRLGDRVRGGETVLATR